MRDGAPIGGELKAPDTPPWRERDPVQRVGVTDCNRNGSGLQSARFWDHIKCLYRHGQDHIICL